jgi:hypothetical protein
MLTNETENRDIDIGRVFQRISNELVDAVKNKNLKSIGKLLVVTDKLVNICGELKLESLSELLLEAKSIWNDWKTKLQIGDRLDVYCERDKIWYSSRILEFIDNGFYIHYDGWNDSFNTEIVNLSYSNCCHLNTFTKEKAIKKSKKRTTVEHETGEIDLSTEQSNGMDSNQKRPLEVFEDADSLNPRQKLRMAKSSKENESFSNEYSTKSEKQMKLFGGREVGTDKNEPICGICYQLEATNGSDFLLCDGPCLRSFHVECCKISKKTVNCSS